MLALSIVIPIFNEQETLPLLIDCLNQELLSIQVALKRATRRNAGSEVEVVFVDDGSTDNSAPLMEAAAQGSRVFRAVNLSRNFGHQSAVSAGLQCARGRCVVVMDADLQDPPELVKDLIDQWGAGFDVVHAVRRKRDASFFKNLAYRTYYKLKAAMSDYPVTSDSGDFSLLDRRVVNVINKLPEKDRYMRGLRAWVGFKQTKLEYDRPERAGGKTKYSLSKLVKLAFLGIMSTSVKPLFLSGLLSIVSFFIVAGIVAYVLLSKINIPADQMPKGWASLMVTISFLGTCQLLSMWLLSLYISKLYREVLSRPTFIIANDTLADQGTQNREA